MIEIEVVEGLLQRLPVEKLLSAVHSYQKFTKINLSRFVIVNIIH